MLIMQENIMQKNLGVSDRFIRIILGLVIIAIGVLYQSYWGVIGAIPLLTSLMGWCPAYQIFGLSTCGVKEKNNPKEA